MKFDGLQKLQQAMLKQNTGVLEQALRSTRGIERTVEQIREIDALARRTQKMMGSLYYTDHLGPILGGLQNSLHSLDVAHRERERWEKLIGVNHPQILAQQLRLPSAIWESSLAQVVDRMRSFGMPDTYPALADRLLAPYNGFSEFARETVGLLEDESDPAREIALSGALVVAEEQVAAAADVALEAIEQPLENTGLIELPRFTLFRAQRADLLAALVLPEDATPSDLVRLSPSAETAQLAWQITKAVVDCNRLARTTGREEIFKPTTAFLDAQNNLPWIAAVDQPSFGNVVDYLYIMLYEAAGKDKLRFDPWLTNEECAVIWTIKHLRNKWLRHDPDHGNQRGIEKSWGSLLEALTSLGASAYPTEATDFRNLHRRLLTEASDFLGNLKERLKSQAPSDSEHSRWRDV